MEYKDKYKEEKVHKFVLYALYILSNCSLQKMGKQ